MPDDKLLAAVRRELDARPGDAFDLASLMEWLKIPASSRSASVQKRLGAALRTCGYTRVSRRIAGRVTRIWYDELFGLDPWGEFPRIHVSP